MRERERKRKKKKEKRKKKKEKKKKMFFISYIKSPSHVNHPLTCFSHVILLKSFSGN
jgi:hypothetical protein